MQAQTIMSGAKLCDLHPIVYVCTSARGGKRCERCEHCSCKDFTIGVKILVKNVIMGGVNFFLSKIVFGECYKGWCFLVFYTVSLCFTLLTCVLHLFGIGFVANRALWVALNLSWITHFWCKFVGPKKVACVNGLTFSTSDFSHKV